MGEQLPFKWAASRWRAVLVLIGGAICSCSRLSDHCHGPCPTLSEAELRVIEQEQWRVFKGLTCRTAIEQACDDGSFTLTIGDGFGSTTEYFDEQGRMVAAQLRVDDGQSRRWGFPSKCAPVSTIDLCSRVKVVHAQLGGTMKVAGASGVWLDGSEVDPSSFFVDAGTHALTLALGPQVLAGELTARADVVGAQWALLDAGTSRVSLQACDALGQRGCEVRLEDRREARLEWRAHVRFPDGGVR